MNDRLFEGSTHANGNGQYRPGRTGSGLAAAQAGALANERATSPRRPADGPAGTALRKFGRRYLTLLASAFVLLGIVVYILAFVFVRTRVLAGGLQALGISFVAFGMTTIIFTYFASALFEDRVVDRIDLHMCDYKRTIDRFTQEFLSRTHQQLMEVTEQLERFVPLFSNCRTLGLENVYITRTEALQDFSKYMTSELNELELAPSADNGPARLWFVSSSMKGFIDTATAEFDGQGLLEQSAKLARCKSLDLRILMTDPALGDERAVQEGRARGDIPNEIEAHLATLKRLGVHREAVRFVPRTPTVFAIATRDVMLLNPYPYGTEAFRSVSIIVRKTPPGGANRTGDRDIYEQYERKHFDAPWAHAVEIEPRYWNDLGVQSPALNLAAGSG